MNSLFDAVRHGPLTRSLLSSHLDLLARQLSRTLAIRLDLEILKQVGETDRPSWHAKWWNVKVTSPQSRPFPA